MDKEQARKLGALMVRFLETGAPPEGLFRPDLFCDYTVPHWRLQTKGVEEAVRLRKEGHPIAGRVSRWSIDPTPDGFVMELEETWDDAGGPWYCREIIRADVSDGQIFDVSVYCTGDWDKARQEEHARTVTLLRPRAKDDEAGRRVRFQRPGRTVCEQFLGAHPAWRPARRLQRGEGSTARRRFKYG